MPSSPNVTPLTVRICVTQPGALQPSVSFASWRTSYANAFGFSGGMLRDCVGVGGAPTACSTAAADADADVGADARVTSAGVAAVLVHAASVSSSASGRRRSTTVTRRRGRDGSSGNATVFTRLADDRPGY